MTKYEYDVWTKPTVKLSEDTDAPMEWSELEGMVFATPVQKGDEITVLLDESYGLPNNNRLPNAPLSLGVVSAIRHYAAFDGHDARTRLALDREIADDRFEKFVKKYLDQRDDNKF